MDVSISIVDYIGKIKDGVAIILSLNINDTIYQIVFWFNKNCHFVMNVGDDLLKLLDIDSIYNYEHLEDLLIKIFQVLPPVKDIFEQFGV